MRQRSGLGAPPTVRPGASALVSPTTIRRSARATALAVRALPDRTTPLATFRLPCSKREGSSRESCPERASQVSRLATRREAVLFVIVLLLRCRAPFHDPRQAIVTVSSTIAPLDVYDVKHVAGSLDASGSPARGSAIGSLDVTSGVW